MRTALFVTCLVDLFRPNVGFATIRLLEAAGCQVDVPDVQTCCGQPAFNNGDAEDARAIARQVIEAFDGYEYVVIPSGSCAGMLTRHYPELFRDDPVWRAKAEGLATRSHELTQFLAEVVADATIRADYPGAVTYHDSCSSLREMRVEAQPRALLDMVDGLRRVEMNGTESCCGFGGTFCVKYPELSERMVNDKVANIEASGADTLLAGDLGCLLNIAGRLKRLDKPVKVYHIAEVLAGMTDVPGIGDGEPKS
jgi:L-lactate dehydrogenase complex protein LldE